MTKQLHFLTCMVSHTEKCNFISNVQGGWQYFLHQQFMLIVVTVNLFYQVSQQEAQLMLTTGSTRLAVSRGQET